MILSYYIYFSYRNDECFSWTLVLNNYIPAEGDSQSSDQIVLHDNLPLCPEGPMLLSHREVSSSSSLVWLELLNFKS